MRKIKLTVKCRVPSWGYCNYDGFTANNRFSKELCRFCVKDRRGYHCVLHDASLAADKDFVYKTAECIDATAGFAITVDEPTPTPGPTIEPKQIVNDTITLYTKTVNDLMKQGYPRPLAESAAKRYIVDGK